MVEDFISMLTDKVERLREMYQGKLYTYVKYHTLTPTIRYSIPFELKVERRLRYKDKVVAVSDVIKHIRTKGHIVIVEAEDGMGKTTLLADMAKQLQADKVNVV
jgi:stage III sporulation protein SpoIIIAA